jgi:hypothetical protein
VTIVGEHDGEAVVAGDVLTLLGRSLHLAMAHVHGHSAEGLADTSSPLESDLDVAERHRTACGLAACVLVVDADLVVHDVLLRRGSRPDLGYTVGVLVVEFNMHQIGFNLVHVDERRLSRDDACQEGSDGNQAVDRGKQVANP